MTAATAPQMERLPHGYTNTTCRDGDTVVKTYRGPDAAARHRREVTALRRLAGLLPVPELLDWSNASITTAFVDGRHGQEMVDSGAAAQVLGTCGRLLKRLQSVHTSLLFDDAPAGTLVHGDFGPNNLLVGDDGTEPLGLVDWEWCGVGSPYADLAWCEFIVRMHHPAEVRALPALFDGYERRPSWELRQQAMLARCATHLAFARRWHDGPGAHVARWIDTIRAWDEI